MITHILEQILALSFALPLEDVYVYDRHLRGSQSTLAFHIPDILKLYIIEPSLTDPAYLYVPQIRPNLICP